MPDIGARLTLKGEAEYKRALQEIAQGQKVMRSEMELVSARFDGQEKSIEGLTAKHDVLDRTLNGERERIETLRQALEKSAAAYGEGDRRTQNWQIQLNKAEASAAKLEREIDKTDKELGELNGTMKESEDTGRGLGDMLNGVAGKFGIDLPEGMTKSMNGMVSLDAKSLALVGGMAALVKALADVEKKLISMTKEQAAAADEILTTADKTGIAAERLQEYAYAAELVDVSVETITGAQTKLIQTMDKARDGAAAQQEAFAKLGVEFRNADGSLRDADDVMWDVLDALGQMENSTERDAAAMDVLGKSARDLNPLIKAGRDRMNELAKEAHDVGYVMSTEQLAALGKVDDATQRYNKSVEALRQKIAVEFAPYLERGTENLTKMVTGLGDALKDSGVVDALGMIFETITEILGPSDRLAKDTIPSLTEVLQPLAVLLASVADAMDLISGLITLDFGKVGRAMGLTYQYGNADTYSHVQAVQVRSRERQWGSSQADLYSQWEAAGAGAGSFEYWKMVNGYNAGGTVNWRGGPTWVGENGPERVFLPAGAAVQSAQESRMDGGMTWYGDIVIDAASIQDIQDVVRIMKELPMQLRKRGR